MVDALLACPFLVSLGCIAVMVFFFYYFGAFKHPWVVSLTMVVSASIPIIMVIGILPYDLSLCMFGSSDEPHKALRMILEILYWVSFVLTWAVVPIMVSFLGYSHSITLKHRIWMTIRENLIFYGCAGGVVVIGVVILLATKSMTIENLLPLGIALANGYGLIVLCLCLGFGVIEMPRLLWQTAKAHFRYFFYLHRIAKETELCATAVADGDAASNHCTNAETHLSGKCRDMYEERGKPRMIKLNQVKSEIPIPDRYCNAQSNNKLIEKVNKIDWEKCTESQLEDFFQLLDNTTLKIEQAGSYVQDSAKQAYRALYDYTKRGHELKAILRKIGSILIGILMAIVVWCEITLMFNIKFSLFYILSHMAMPQVVSILLVSTPILSFILFVGSWTLTKLRLGSFFRFIKGATNANSLNYFAILISRVGPTIGFHYLNQIGATGSQFNKVMGKMNVVIFIGDQWNLYSPILMLVVMVFAAFNIVDRILACFGKERFSFDMVSNNYETLAAGEEILSELDSDARELVESGFSFSQIAEKEKINISRDNNTESLTRKLNDVAP